MAWTIEERDGVGHGRLWIMDERGRCVCTVYREIDDPWRVARAIAALPATDAAIRQDQGQRVSLEDGTGPTSYIERDADGLPTRMWFSTRRER